MMKRTKVLQLLLCLVLVTGCNVNEDCVDGNIILFNSTIYTLDGDNTKADSMVVSGNQIAFVGKQEDTKKYECGAFSKIDIQGNYIFPGFTDSHAHLKGIGYRETTLNLQGINSLKETIQVVRDFSKSKEKGEWVVGRGWIEKLWPEKRFPTKEDIDQFSKDRPIFLERADGHAVLVNSYALNLAGIDASTEDPHGGAIRKGEDGKPTGILVDKAISLVEKLLPPKSQSEDKKALEEGLKRSVRLGWTQIQNAGGSYEDFELLKQIKLEGNLVSRIYYAVSDGEPALELLKMGPQLDPENMLIARGVKLYADGALGSRGAFLLKNYSDFKSKGLLIFKKEETIPKLIEALKKGIQIQTHAIGDAANKITLDWYEEAFKSVPKEGRYVPKPRWRIEHSQNIQTEDILRFRDLEVIASMQPSHAIGDLHFAIDRLGLKRVKNAYKWNTLIKEGVLVIGGTDAPVEIGDPLIEFYAAVTRKDVDGFYAEGWHLEEAISRLEALKMFTLWPSFGAFQEDIRGSIEVGKLADLTVFSKDIMTIEAEEILKTQNVLTMVHGKVVFNNLKKRAP